MGSYYKQIAARFRRQAAEAQREKSVVDGKISRLRKASSSLASEIQSIDNRARSLGQILPLDSSSFKGSRQQDFEGHFYNLERILLIFEIAITIIKLLLRIRYVVWKLNQVSYSLQ